MPGNKRGSIDDIVDAYVRLCSELQDAGVYHKVAIHAVVKFGENLSDGIKSGNYSLTVAEENAGS